MFQLFVHWIEYQLPWLKKVLHGDGHTYKVLLPKWRQLSELGWQQIEWWCSAENTTSNMDDDHPRKKHNLRSTNTYC